jgi:hypothetical protein
MAIQVNICEDIPRGCRITIRPDAEDTVAYLQQLCDDRGWELSPSDAVPNTPWLRLRIQGPSAAELRAQLQNNCEFDFSHASLSPTEEPAHADAPAP